MDGVPTPVFATQDKLEIHRGCVVSLQDDGVGKDMYDCGLSGAARVVYIATISI